jgi:hypothetical protein
MTKQKKQQPKKQWSEWSIIILKTYYPERPTREVAESLERSIDAAKKKAKRLRLRKSKKYLKSIGRK